MAFFCTPHRRICILNLTYSSHTLISSHEFNSELLPSLPSCDHSIAPLPPFWLSACVCRSFVRALYHSQTNLISHNPRLSIFQKLINLLLILCRCVAALLCYNPCLFRHHSAPAVTHAAAIIGYTAPYCCCCITIKWIWGRWIWSRPGAIHCHMSCCLNNNLNESIVPPKKDVLLFVRFVYWRCGSISSKHKPF